MDKLITERSLNLELDSRVYWVALEVGNRYLYKLHDYRRARIYLLRAIKINPNEWRAYHSLSDLFTKEGDTQAAESANRQAMALKMLSDPNPCDEAFAQS